MTPLPVPESKPLTVLELLSKARPWLAGKGIESAKVDSEILLAQALKIRRIDVYLQFDRTVSTVEQDAFRALIKRRSAGEPVAYLTGRREFYSLEFEVGPAVLIPRPETETLVEVALARGGAPRPGGGALRVLDVGTGSGCIAIVLARELPDAQVVAVDRSRDALAIAARNAEQLAPGRVTFHEGDGFAALAPGDRFDLVVSNPPYISTQDVPGLMRDVRDFEPHAALDGGATGMEFVKAWATGAFARLDESGWAVFEIGAGQGEAAESVFRAAGFEEVSVRQDLSGIPRVVSGRHA